MQPLYTTPYNSAASNVQGANEIQKLIWGELHIQASADAVLNAKEFFTKHQQELSKRFIDSLRKTILGDNENRRVQGLPPIRRIPPYLMGRAWENLNKSLGHVLADANLNESASGKQNANQKQNGDGQKSAGVF